MKVLRLIIFPFLATANESLPSQDNRSLRSDAHDWHKLVSVAERSDSGDQTRDFIVLRSGKWHFANFLSSQQQNGAFDELPEDTHRSRTCSRHSWTQRTASHLRMSTNEHHRNFSSRRFAVSVSMHNRIFADLCCHFVRDVAWHLSTTLGTTSAHQRRPVTMQTIATSLFRRLCTSAQRTFHWNFDSRFNDHFADFVLRVDLTTGVRDTGGHRSDNLRTDAVRHGDDGHVNRNVSSASFAIRFFATFSIG